MSIDLISYLLKANLLSPEHQAELETLPPLSRSVVFEMVERGWIDSQKLLCALGRFFRLPIYNLSAHDMTTLPLEGLPCTSLCTAGILPLFQTSQTLYIAVADGTPTPFDQTLASIYRRKIARVLVDARILMNALHQLQAPTIAIRATPELQPLSETYFILQEALKHRASDIHIEPDQNHLRIRMRCDGMLHTLRTYPVQVTATLTARLKVLAQLDIGERRLPQDGRFQIPAEISPLRFDCRISTCPTLFGEKIAIRILDPRQMRIGVDALGCTSEQKTSFLSALEQPQGLILVTGPTGSGKTVSLYTALQHMHDPCRNIMTAEDPVEIYLPGIQQVPIQPRIGLNFSTALRAFLRQDPDILMIGEIRDAETAEMSLKAAQTGHLVLSTLHTNSAVEAVIRLQQMGIPTYHIASALTLIVAQRLVRRLCSDCKVPDPLHPTYYCATPAGCARCLGGYAGRLGIFEMLPLSKEIQGCILQHASATELMTRASAAGMLSLYQMGLQKVQEGITSLAELHRVVSPT